MNLIEKNLSTELSNYKRNLRLYEKSFCSIDVIAITKSCDIDTI